MEYVRKIHPEYMDHVSTVVSPMIAMARAIRAKDRKARIVFIGPCTAKKVEIKQDDVKGAVDYVLTFEELRAILDARGLELAEIAGDYRRGALLLRTDFCKNGRRGGKRAPCGKAGGH